MTFQIPLTFILISAVNRRYNQLTLKTGKKPTLKQTICEHLPFTVIFTVQVIMAYLFWMEYGTMAFILGPLRTWSLVLAAIVYYTALHLPEKCFRWVWILFTEPVWTWNILRRAKEICFTKSETSVNQEIETEESVEKVGKSNWELIQYFVIFLSWRFIQYLFMFWTGPSSFTYNTLYIQIK